MYIVYAICHSYTAKGHAEHGRGKQMCPLTPLVLGIGCRFVLCRTVRRGSRETERKEEPRREGSRSGRQLWLT